MSSVAQLRVLRPVQRKFDERSALHAIGAVLSFVAPLPLYWLFAPQKDYTEAGLVIAVVEVIAALVCAIHFARDNFEVAAFGIGLLAKLSACGVYLHLCYTIYTENDAFGYFNRALAISEGGTIQFVFPSTSTNAIYNLTAIVVSLTPSITFAFCTFTLTAFFGQMLLYRAFCIGVPNGNRRLAAVMCFFFPSLIFWTSPVGKDAIVLFGLALASVGVARLFSHRVSASILPILLGLIIVQFIRPHIAALFGCSLGVTYLLLWRSRNVTGILIKFLAVPLLLVFAVWLGYQTQSTFGLQSVEGAVVRADSIRSFTGAQGGSDFGYYDPIWYRVLTSPFLLFRPFPWEVVNFFSGLAAAEGVFAFVMLVSRRRVVSYFLSRWHEYPFVSFVAAYSLLSIASLSTVINNMGTLARQRVMVFPLFVVLCCFGFHAVKEQRNVSWKRG
jgi:hypothetical protein